MTNQIRISDLLMDWGPDDPPVPGALLIALIDEKRGRSIETVLSVVERAHRAGDPFVSNPPRMRNANTGEFTDQVDGTAALEWYDGKVDAALKADVLAAKILDDETPPDVKDPDMQGIYTPFGTFYRKG